MIKKNKYFYRTVLISSVCAGSLAFYFLSDSKIFGAAPSGDISYLLTEVTNNAEAIQGNEELDTTTEMNEVEADTESVKEASGEDSLAEVQEEMQETKEHVYTVESGQTLWEIAQETNTSIQEIMQENQLTNSVVKEGQELILE